MPVFERKSPAPPATDPGQAFVVQTLAKVAAGQNLPRLAPTPAALNSAFRNPLVIPPEET
ncbi:hypothetical protein EOD42_14055 [Rhodovarius crocodyli]|uniref:Uncharacterized protein n=1 Tax=Rhodovarius crocodyli TaxID=1979269 RepID=A0A437MF27_9PROT|nr:hypothetical protein [Rhodovarius crocodyli]RVT96233.1 hypothetical protein EOD42_14055 [Rhodovarius crocodyli]